MSIDIERLKWDAAYWDEVAPEGATHFCPETDEEIPAWWINPTGEVGRPLAKLAYVADDKWSQAKFDEHTKVHAIPRPKPQSSEWDGEGLPPVGCECEFKAIDPDSGPFNGRKCFVISNGKDAHGNDVTTAHFGGDGYKAFLSECFRPLRTKEQREREELREDLGGILPFCEYDEGQIKELSEILYAQGYRKPEAK